ncbi:hypothetical protein C8R43DRAFT_1135557 [Mycena crocata]|nr:hypothetical protein C8R43DRAFT_1135557 [Mycena crocata]
MQTYYIPIIISGVLLATILFFAFGPACSIFRSRRRRTALPDDDGMGLRLLSNVHADSDDGHHQDGPASIRDQIVDIHDFSGKEHMLSVAVIPAALLEPVAHPMTKIMHKTLAGGALRTEPPSASSFLKLNLLRTQQQIIDIDTLATQESSPTSSRSRMSLAAPSTRMSLAALVGSTSPVAEGNPQMMTKLPNVARQRNLMLIAWIEELERQMQSAWALGLSDDSPPGYTAAAGCDCVQCKAWTSFAAYAGWLSIVISNFLVLLRIWTTLPRGHRLIRWSIVFFVVVQTASFGVTTWVVTNMIPVLVFEPFVGLCTFTTKPNVVGLWVVGIIFEIVVFVTVFWNTLDRPRAMGPDSEVAVTRMLLRDGVAYFVLLCGLRIANAVIAVVAPVSSLFVIVFFIWAATTLTTNRLIINSRRGVGKAARLREAQLQMAAGREQPRRNSGTWRIRAGSANDCEGPNGDVDDRTESSEWHKVGDIESLAPLPRMARSVSMPV